VADIFKTLTTKTAFRRYFTISYIFQIYPISTCITFKLQKKYGREKKWIMKDTCTLFSAVLGKGFKPTRQKSC
jgi:hypothetical protein